MVRFEIRVQNERQMKDYYAILGVREGAGPAEIKRAYRMLAIKYHPDKNSSPEAEVLIKEINEAYDVLGDIQKKYLFDTRRRISVREVFRPEPEVQNDNPRYRRRRPAHYKPAPRRENFRDLIREYHPRMIWINALGILLIALLAIDYFLPTSSSSSRIVSIRTSYTFSNGYRYYDYDIIETSDGEHIHVGDHIADNFSNVNYISIRRTPMFSTIRAISNSRETFSIYVDGIYGPIGFVPLVLLLTSILAFRHQEETDMSYNFTVVSATLLLISICLIFAL